MANSNSPLVMIEGYEKVVEGMKQASHAEDFNVAISWRHLQWLLADAKHLNELNARAIECNYEDASAMMVACLDYKK